MKTFKEFVAESMVKDAAGYYLDTNTMRRYSSPNKDHPGQSSKELYDFHKKKYEEGKAKGTYKSHIEYDRVRMNRHGKKLGIPSVPKESKGSNENV